MVSCPSYEASIGSINLALHSLLYVFHTLAVGLNGVPRSCSILCTMGKGTCRMSDCGMAAWVRAVSYGVNIHKDRREN